eukprot:7821446-Pyramimonas_sp.AAC.1
MAESDSDDRRPLPSGRTAMSFVEQARGDERAPGGAQTGNFEEVKSEGGIEQREETQATALGEDTSKPET